MHRYSISALSLALAAAGLLSVVGSTGCGSNSKGTTSSHPQTLQYKVTLTGANTSNGTVSVDTGGTVTVTLTGATASTSYDLQFCPAPAQTYTCFIVGTVMADGSGNANVTLTFPKSGSWAGDFHLDSGGNTVFQTDVGPGITSQVFLATLQPSTTANGSGIFINNFVPTSQDPLSSGTVEFASGAFQFKLQGASPNTTYSAGECPTYFGSSCYTLVGANSNSAFTTDSSGNAIFAALQDGTAGDIFEVDAPGTRAGFVAGFKVP